MVATGVLSPESSDGRVHGAFVNEDDEEKRKQADDLAPPTPTPSEFPNNNNNNKAALFWLPSSSGTSLKPFLDGGLTELLRFSTVFPVCYLFSILDRDSHLLKQALPGLTYAKVFKRLPGQELILFTSSTLRFGIYENLTRGVETYNKGSPLSIYQQVCCGLATGSAVACITTPIDLVCARKRFQATFTEIYQDLYQTAHGQGILSLWRGSSLLAHARIAMNTGMLASYDRSFNYFRGSLGLTEIEAILGAGAVSSFFASACCQPFVFVQQFKNSIHLTKDAARRYQHMSSLDIALEVFKQRGPLGFFGGFGKNFCRLSPPIMCTWYFLEVIRKFEFLEKSSG